MPDVTIRYDGYYSRGAIVDSPVLLKLRDILPAIIAEQLSTTASSGTLTPSDIELNFHQYGELDVHGGYVLEIIVEANLYRERSKDIDRRTQRIKDAIAALPSFINLHLKDDQWFVWVKLSKASFR